MANVQQETLSWVVTRIAAGTTTYNDAVIVMRIVRENTFTAAMLGAAFGLVVGLYLGPLLALGSR